MHNAHQLQILDDHRCIMTSVIEIDYIGCYRQPALMADYVPWQPAIVMIIVYFAFILNYSVNKLSHSLS